jgi:hypothetical protein
MSLSKPTLKASIKSALLAQRDNTTDPVQAADDLAEAISSAVDSYVRSLRITYTSGLVAPSGGGLVVGSLGYTLS